MFFAFLGTQRSGLEWPRWLRGSFLSGLHHSTRGPVDVHFTVKLADLKRAVRRLTMRLGDESPIGEGFVILRVALNRLTIETANSAEELTADVHQAGTANVPVAVFCALAKTLRYHRRERVQLCVSTGGVGVDRMVIRHSGICIT